MKAGPKPKSLAERFWPKVQKGTDDECWIWTGAKDPNGYGRIQALTTDEKWTAQLAHRISYELANGTIDPNSGVCHSCDNPQCVNPAHLFLGSQAINMEDAKQKGRIKNQSNGHTQSMKTHCIRGHEYTEANTYRPPGKNERWCRECQRMHNRNFKLKHRTPDNESL